MRHIRKLYNGYRDCSGLRWPDRRADHQKQVIYIILRLHINSVWKYKAYQVYSCISKPLKWKPHQKLSVYRTGRQYYREARLMYSHQAQRYQLHSLLRRLHRLWRHTYDRRATYRWSRLSVLLFRNWCRYILSRSDLESFWIRIHRFLYLSGHL